MESLAFLVTMLVCTVILLPILSFLLAVTGVLDKYPILHWVVFGGLSILGFVINSFWLVNAPPHMRILGAVGILILAFSIYSELNSKRE